MVPKTITPHKRGVQPLLSLLNIKPSRNKTDIQMCHIQAWLLYPKSTCPKTSIFWIKTSKIKGMFVTHQREEWIGSGLWGMRARIQHLKNNYAYMNGMCARHLSCGRKQKFDYTCSLVFSRCTSSATFQNPQPLTQKDKASTSQNKKPLRAHRA